MYEHHQLLEARLRHTPDRLTRLLAQDALVEPAPPPAIGRSVARALLLIAALVTPGVRLPARGRPRWHPYPSD
jgi:hypothetical protein